MRSHEHHAGNLAVCVFVFWLFFLQQRQHQSSAWYAFCEGKPPMTDRTQRGPIMQKAFPYHGVSASLWSSEKKSIESQLVRNPSRYLRIGMFRRIPATCTGRLYFNHIHKNEHICDRLWIISVFSNRVIKFRTHTHINVHSSRTV